MGEYLDGDMTIYSFLGLTLGVLLATFLQCIYGILV